MNYSELIKSIREKLFLSQTELSKELGVSYAMVNRKRKIIDRIEASLRTWQN